MIINAVFSIFQQTKFGESVEAMLTKLEEFTGLVDMVTISLIFS